MGDVARSRTALWLGLIMLLGAGLRLTGINSTGYWTDELFSVVWSREPLSFLWRQGMAIETNPPFYYTLLHYWMMAFGNGEVQVRMLGALASIAAIPAVFALTLEFAAAPLAAGAALLIAVAPVQVDYAHEARAYALLPLLVTVATLGLVRFVRRGQTGALVLYAAAAVALMYTHATGAFVLVALNLCTLIALLAERDARSVRSWLIANAIVAALAIPELLAMVSQRHSPDISWIARPSLTGLAQVLDVVMVGLAPPQLHLRIATLAAVALTAALTVAVVRRPPPRLALLMVAAPAVVFLAMVTLISFRWPILLPRVAVWMSVPVCVLAALTLRDRINAVLLATTFLLCCAMGLAGAWQLMPLMKEDWRGLMADLAPRLAHGDQVAVVGGCSPLGIVFYGGPREVLRYAPTPPQDAQAFAADLGHPVHLASADEIVALAREGHLWLVLDETTEREQGAAIAQLLPPPQVILHTHPRIEALGWTIAADSR